MGEQHDYGDIFDCDSLVEPAPYDASGADPASFLGRRGGLWQRAAAGYFFEGGCPRCRCADCEPDRDGWLTCEIAEIEDGWEVAP
jgi:hypothetical protein